MGRRFWIVVLAIGAFGGFAMGFARLHHYRQHGNWGYGHGHWGHDRHAAFEQHVAEVCTQAAGKVWDSKNKPGTAPQGAAP